MASRSARRNGNATTQGAIRSGRAPEAPEQSPLMPMLVPGHASGQIVEPWMRSSQQSQLAPPKQCSDAKIGRSATRQCLEDFGRRRGGPNGGTIEVIAVDLTQRVGVPSVART